MKYVSLEDILRLHFEIISDFGGSHGVRAEDRLASAVEAPQQEAFGQEQYPSVFEKAAVYIRNISHDHPFVDGNKRTAITVGGIFLTRNKHSLTASPKELEEFVIQVVVDHLSVEQIAKWLQKHTIKD